MPLSRAELESAEIMVRSAMAPTPCYPWPLLSARVGTEVWLKHENTAPTGAFKVRGGLVYLARLKAARPECRGVVAATRGNHGQSIAFAATRHGLSATVVAPQGNSPGKNRAMRALGAELIEHGYDFQAAFEHAHAISDERRLTFIPSFHPDLVAGVASYALELFRSAGPLDAVYVPIGLGSGICGVMAARDALGLTTEVIGVVSTEAPAYALSFDAKRSISTNSANTLADGMACRVPVAEAVDQILTGASRIVRVSDEEILEAIGALFDDCHTLAEGAGAAPLAALMQERGRMAGKRVALIVSGGNIDGPLFRRALDRARA